MVFTNAQKCSGTNFLNVDELDELLKIKIIKIKMIGQDQRESSCADADNRKISEVFKKQVEVNSNFVATF